MLHACIGGSAAAQSPNAKRWFDEAVQLDLSGEPEARHAFDLYMRAAKSGWPAAEFNVAVMLDSGRGTTLDMAQAALWYARAAAHGERRAAYNLGQLYEAGEGVPKNVDLARAWFTQSDLPAARERIAAVPAREPASGPLSAPLCVAPEKGARASADVGGIELVWTSVLQPEPVRFFVELHAIAADHIREIFAGSTSTTSAFVALPATPTHYAWRVSALARQGGTYMTSDWSDFDVVADPP